MDIHKKKIMLIIKMVMSRGGLMAIFTTMMTILIFKVTMNEHLDEFFQDGNSAQINIDQFVHATADNGYANQRSKDSLNIMFGPNIEKNVVQNVEEIPCPMIEVANPCLLEGQTAVAYQGTPGENITEYEQIIINGEVKQVNKLLSRQVKPIAGKIFVGCRKSSINKIVDLNEYGCPRHFKKLHAHMCATAYTAPYGARTSTGKIANVGYVAVNKNVIPYHSKLYIKCCNSSFVYGYAEAEDTGGAMRRGDADIDLFFRTKEECINFGRQAVDVYILEN